MLIPVPPPTVPVLLRGHLGAKFGPRFDLAVDTPAEAVQMLCLKPGFREYVTNSKGGFKVLVADTPIGVDDLGQPCGGKSIRIIPCVMGADGDFGKIILGAALIVGSTFLPLGWGMAAKMMVSIGASMALGGVAGLLASPPDPSSYEQDKRNPSYLFSGGGVNPISQGIPVPVLMGRMEIPGVRISGGLNSDPWNPTELGGTGDDGVVVEGGGGGIGNGHVFVISHIGG